MKKIYKRIPTYTLCIILCLIIMYPIVFIVSCSFFGSRELADNFINLFYLIRKEFSLSGYQIIFYSFRFQSGLIFSLIYAICITFLQYVFGISSGFVLAKFRFKFNEALYFAYLLCMIMPFSVIVLPQYMLFNNIGIYDSVFAIILPGGFGAMGVFFYRQFIKQIPNNILEAAQVDGASPLVLLKKILAPMLKDCTFAYMVICFCTNWNSIDPSIAFIRSVSIQPLSVALKEAFNNAPEVFFAPAVLYMVPPVLVYFFFSEELIRGLSFNKSSTKGPSHEI